MGPRNGSRDDVAVFLRKRLEALTYQWAELEDLRARVIEAEQNKFTSRSPA